MQPLFDRSSAHLYPDSWVQAIVIRTQEYSVDHLLHLLSSEEYKKYSSLKVAQHKHDYALAHLLKRRVLAGYLGEKKPQQLQFDHSRFGKPRLTKQALHFNISHSHGFVALAFSQAAPCGIDIEKHRALSHHRSLINASMTATEQLAISTHKTPAQAFFQRWVAKEAFIKAQGIGLTQPLQDICYDSEHYPFWQSQQQLSQQQLWCLSTEQFSAALCSLDSQPHFYIDYPV